MQFMFTFVPIKADHPFQRIPLVPWFAAVKTGYHNIPWALNSYKTDMMVTGPARLRRQFGQVTVTLNISVLCQLQHTLQEFMCCLL